MNDLSNSDGWTPVTHFIVYAYQKPAKVDTTSRQQTASDPAPATGAASYVHGSWQIRVVRGAG